MVYIKHYASIDRQMTELLFLMLKQQNTKREKKNSLRLTKKKYIYIYIYTAALIGINLYSVLSLYFFIQFLECSC